MSRDRLLQLLLVKRPRLPPDSDRRMRTFELPLLMTGPGTKAVAPLPWRVMPPIMHPRVTSLLVPCISAPKWALTLYRLVAVILRRRILIGTFSVLRIPYTLSCRLRNELIGEIGKQLFPMFG